MILSDHSNRLVTTKILNRLEQQGDIVSEVTDAMVAPVTEEAANPASNVVVIHKEAIRLTAASRWRQMADRAEARLRGIKCIILSLRNPVHFLGELVFAPYLSRRLGVLSIGPNSRASLAYKTARHGRRVELRFLLDRLAVSTNDCTISQARRLRTVIAKVELKLFGWHLRVAPSTRNAPSDAVGLIAGSAVDTVRKQFVHGEHFLAPLASTACAPVIGLSYFHYFGTFASMIKRLIAPETVIDQAAASSSTFSRMRFSTRKIIFSVFGSGFICTNESNTAKAVCQYQIQQKERGFFLNFAA